MIVEFLIIFKKLYFIEVLIKNMVDPFGMCKCKCGHMVPLTDNNFKKYFETGFECFLCKRDIWDILINSLEGVDLILGFNFYILGCLPGKKTLSLNANEIFTWNISEDIKNGELLNLHLFSLGNTIRPVILHDDVPDHPLKTEKVLIYGRSIDPSVDEIKLELRYVYAPENIKDDLSIMLLLDAFKFFHEKNYRYMVISAHNSIEISLENFIESALINNGVSITNTESLLKQATHAYRLKSLLPFITNMIGFPSLNQCIYDSLEHLRKDRNNLIHEGEVDLSDIDRLKNELISVVFAHKYFKIYNEF